jgi:thiamine biosynthesis lipoprotein
LADATPRGATLRRMRIEMGTSLVIEAHAASQTEVHSAVEAAFAAAGEVARYLHPGGADSDLRRIGAAPGTHVPISAATFVVLRFAQHLHQVSGGLFDPCLPARPGSVADIELTGGGTPRAIARRELDIDCGGIAKGYAVDVAIETLRRGGCSAGLVNAGGDLRVFGALGEPLLLRGPGGGYRTIRLENAALAVSERDAAAAPSGHRGYYARVGGSVLRRYAAVRAGDAMTADALTKCVLLGSTALTDTLLEKFGAESIAALD